MATNAENSTAIQAEMRDPPSAERNCDTGCVAGQRSLGRENVEDSEGRKNNWGVFGIGQLM
jgi:hypothetical protein